MIGFIFAILIGGLAGYLASRFMKAENSIFLNVILGVAGSSLLNIILGIIFGLWSGNILWQLLTGIVGASLLIWGYRKYKERN